jgi:AraC-like DNA-binding protein
VPLERAFRFGELACRTQGTEHLGLHVGLASSLNDLGPYGRILEEALTVHDYLRKGISLYNLLNTGQWLWLSEHGEELRLNIATLGESEIGKYQSQLETLVVTIGKLREAAGPDWAPRAVSFAYHAREDLPEVGLFAGSRILRGTGETYLSMPREIMGLRFPARGDFSLKDLESSAGRPLPEDLGGLVQLQIESLLPCRGLQIAFVAETLAMTPRSLQRALARQGLTYSQLLAETRMRKAAHWLENTDKPISEIAFDLCYTDASNFTRAFRLQTGVPPQTFRDKARRT